MGMVYRRPGRPVYMMKYYEHGKVVRKSTGTDNEKEALKVLREHETLVDKGVPGTRQIGKLRFDEAMEHVKNDYRANKRKSFEDIEGRIDNHLTPFFGGRKMAAITTADAQAYIAHRMAEGVIEWRGPRKGQRIRDVESATINRELDALRRGFTLAKQAGLIFHEPHIPKLDEDTIRTGFFEKPQFEAVCAKLPQPVAQVIRFAYVTGWRVTAEVLPLEWSQVDFHECLTPEQAIAGTVRLERYTTKNKEPRVFPFTSELRELLLEQRAEADRLQREGHIIPWVFFRLKAKGRGGDKAPHPIRSYLKAWTKAARAAGLPGKIPHDFRRTAARNLVRAGVSEQVAMRLTGHKTRSVFERYNIVSDGDLGTAAARLDQSTSQRGQDGAATGGKKAVRGAHWGARQGPKWAPQGGFGR